MYITVDHNFKKSLWSKLLADRLFLDLIALAKCWLLGLQLVQNINLIIGTFTSHMSIKYSFNGFGSRSNTLPGLRAIGCPQKWFFDFRWKTKFLMKYIDGSAKQETELHLVMSGQQELVSTQYCRGPSCTGACLHYRGLFWTWTCLCHRDLSCTWIFLTLDVSTP